MNTEAAAILMVVEQEHACWNWEYEGDDLFMCSGCFTVDISYPCPTLLAARSAVSPKTLKYVSAQLALENGSK